MIVNLTKNRFLQQVQKIELINWEWTGIHYAAQRKPFSKNVQLCNISPRNLGDPFMVKGGDFFQKKKKKKFVGTNL